MRHLTSCWVVTTPRDDAVKAVVASVPGAVLYETDDFHAHGARFNKGLCVERCFDMMGRSGWLAVIDGDVLWPDSVPFGLLQPGRLHGARRRVLEDPSLWTPGLNWQTCPLHRDGNAPVGFTQIFHADDPAIKSIRPWYDVSFAHAGGGDAYFLEHWKRAGRQTTMLPMEVLHLGPVDRNWFGADPEGREIMAAFVTRNGWGRAIRGLPAGAGDGVGNITERVEVPGYPPSDYELPFVRRNRK